MIPDDVLEELICFSEEEINNLNNENTIDRSIYLSENSNVVDCNKIFTNNEMFSVRKHARFREYPKHRHNYIEFMYVYAGEMRHVIDDKEVVIKKGELLLLNQNVEHSIKYASENDIIFNFIIRPEFLEFLASIMDEDNEIFRFIFNVLYSWDNKEEYLVFRVAEVSRIKDMVEEIIINVYRPQINNMFILKMRIGLLLAELMNYPENIETHAADSTERLLSINILNYINENYKEGSLQVLSNKLKIPDYKICKIIKKYTGKTFKQIVQEVRLKNTVDLLKTTNMPIVDIMEEAGYENITYFYKIFKEKYKMTPNEYRNYM